MPRNRVHPVGTYLLLEPITETISPGGIHVVEVTGHNDGSPVQKIKRARVVEVGKDVKPYLYTEQAIVLYSVFGAEEVKDGDRKLLFCPEKEIRGVEDPSPVKLSHPEVIFEGTVPLPPERTSSTPIPG
jgi:hypothetical protein